LTVISDPTIYYAGGDDKRDKKYSRYEYNSILDSRSNCLWLYL